MFVWQHCRHGEVRWLDAYTCRCNDCGKTGIWYEEGLVLWCKRRTIHELAVSRIGADNAMIENIGGEHAEHSEPTSTQGIAEQMGTRPDARKPSPETDPRIDARIDPRTEPPKRSRVGIAGDGIRFPQIPQIPPSDQSSAAVA